MYSSALCIRECHVLRQNVRHRFTELCIEAHVWYALHSSVCNYTPQHGNVFHVLYAGGCWTHETRHKTTTTPGGVLRLQGVNVTTPSSMHAEMT